MIDINSKTYEVVLRGQYYLGDIIESISLEDSIQNIAYKGTIKLVTPDNWQGIDAGDDIYVSGIPFNGNDYTDLLNPAVVWNVDNRYSGTDKIDVTVYDKTIYLEKSEDEYIFPAGQTASQRIKKYCSDWGIPIFNLPETNTPLPKAVYRSETIYSMMNKDLMETVKNGGEMYRPRMTPNGFELYKVGSNEIVWILDYSQNVLDITQNRTLEGTYTKVKVLGNRDNNPQSIDTSGMTLEEVARKFGADTGDTSKIELPSPVLDIESKDTDKYGTLQKIIQDDNVKSVADAKKMAQLYLSGVQETFTVNALDINTVRAGDVINLYGLGDLIVISVTHELGMVGKMSLTLGTSDYVKRRYFIGK